MKKTKKVALLSFASLLALSLVACGDLNGTGGTGSGNGGSSDSDVVAVLPGTSGGTSNESDKFAGKTFYDKSSEAESYTKYVFGNDGTFTVSSKESTYDSETSKWSYGDFEEVPTYEYKYSLSSDGKTLYTAVYKATIHISEKDERLMTYSELMDFLKGDEAKSISKGQWDKLTDEQRKSSLSDYGLDETAGFDEVYQAMLKMSEEMYKPGYSQVSPYSISTETDTSANSYMLLTGTVDSDSKDLSKMNFTGRFDKSSSGSGSRIDYFSIYSVSNGSVSSSVSIYLSSGSSSSTYCRISKIDAEKIYFETSSSSEEKETFDATYTVEGSGADTKIKVTFPADKGGETVELSFKPETMSLYEAK